MKKANFTMEQLVIMFLVLLTFVVLVGIIVYLNGRSETVTGIIDGLFG